MLIRSLKNQKEFDLVNRSGIKFPTPHFIAIVANNVNLPRIVPRNNDCNLPNIFFGMKAGKKLGCAVIRNKIKRRIRHLIRLLTIDIFINTNSNYCFIIIPKKNFDKVEFSLLLTSIQNIVKKLKHH